MAYANVDTLVEFVKNNTPNINGEATMECVERAIKEAPTADVAEVVRCKDCKRCELDYPCKFKDEEAMPGYYCKVERRYVSSEHFCSYGERKGGGAK